MIRQQRQVENFIRLAIANGAKQTIGDYRFPALADKELRIRLCEEELKETIQGWEKDDLFEVIDGYIDQIYIALGALVSIGVDFEPLFDAVHKANMAKFAPGFTVREDGKFIKPPNWTPPDLKAVLVSNGAHIMSKTSLKPRSGTVYKGLDQHTQPPGRKNVD